LIKGQGGRGPYRGASSGTSDFVVGERSREQREVKGDPPSRLDFIKGFFLSAYAGIGG